MVSIPTRLMFHSPISHQIILKGVVDKIIVSPKMSKNRDNETKPIGHTLKINFKLPIVNDSLNTIMLKRRVKGIRLKMELNRVQSSWKPI